MRAVEARVTGRVQGVFFRASCATEARRLGVAGWVANEADGSVRVHAEGPDAAVGELLEWCHEGPPRADVEEVAVSESSPSGAEVFESR